MQPLGGEAESRLAAWLEAETGIRNARLGPLLAGGNANVTRLLEAEGRRMVLRHPPANLVSEKAAAGISREFTALRALHGRAPVPRPLAWCDDASILGQPFAVTEWLDGLALSDTLPDAYGEDYSSVNALGCEMIKGLAAVHRVDTSELLLPGFGQPESFVLRQINRWQDVRARQAVRDLPLLEEIASWLRAHQPSSNRVSLIHCDFHLDNCLVSRSEPRLLAILDWEMATLGDPLVDLGLCLFFWRRHSARALGFPRVQALSNRTDALSRTALADLWSEHSGFDHADLRYYMVFSAWRLAAIVEGAYALFREGKEDNAYVRGLEYDVPRLLIEAAAYIRQESI